MDFNKEKMMAVKFPPPPRGHFDENTGVNKMNSMKSMFNGNKLFDQIFR